MTATDPDVASGIHPDLDPVPAVDATARGPAEPPTRRRWTRTAVAALLAVALAAWSLSAHRRADEAASDRAAASTLRQEQAAIRRSRQTEVDDLIRRIDGERAATDDAAASEAQRQATLADLDGALADLHQRAELLLAQRSFVGDLASMQSAQQQTIADCLHTVSGARFAFAEHRSDDAIATLASGSASCRAAQGIIDGTADAADFPYDFPDPAVLVVGDTAFAWATNGSGGPIQVLSSSGFGGWKLMGSALTGVPGWAVPGRTWAPAVTRVGSTFLLYYSVTERTTGRQCISVAQATNPAGPFVDGSWWPLVCQLAQGGSIDPSVVVAPEGRYLLWKSEGETNGGIARLWSQRLGDDGISLVGDAHELLRADRGWEGATIEGPTMADIDGRWILLYSANRWNTDAYAIGEAVCAGPTGPCTKQDDPILVSGNGLSGPGGPDLFRDRAGSWRIAFHAWPAAGAQAGGSRRLHLGTPSMREDGRVAIDW